MVGEWASSGKAAVRVPPLLLPTDPEPGYSVLSTVYTWWDAFMVKGGHAVLKQFFVFSILRMMVVTAIAAICFCAIAYESPWWRATLTTTAIGFIMSALIGTAILRGTKQAGAIGYAIGSFVYFVSLYTLFGLETLPMLITQKAYPFIVAITNNPPSEEHYYAVALVVWAIMCGYSGAFLARFLYWRTQSSLPQVDTNPSVDAAQT